MLDNNVVVFATVASAIVQLIRVGSHSTATLYMKQIDVWVTIAAVKPTLAQVNNPLDWLRSSF